jgi:predicted metal-dependent hydrolase
MFLFWKTSSTPIISSVSVIRVPRLRRLSLRVEPGGEIVVRAPRRVSDAAIRRFVQDQQEWIQKQKKRMEALVPISQTELQEFKKTAKIYLPKRVAELAEKHDFQYTSVTCRHQQTRWGSCSFRNSINLNIELMRLPEHLRDYIIIHELTHTVHKHHQKAFWHHLEKVLPGALEMDREMKQWKIGYFPQR